MDESQRWIGRPQQEFPIQDELIDTLDVLLAPLHHESRDPEDAIVEHDQPLHKPLPVALIAEAAERPLDDRGVHGGEVRPQPHVF